MVLKHKILLSLLMSVITLPASARKWSFSSESTLVETKDKTMDLELLINGSTKMIMNNIPTEGNLEIYNIIGVLVLRVNLKQCYSGTYSIDLPKGIFILKAGTVACRIVAK